VATLIRLLCGEALAGSKPDEGANSVEEFLPDGIGVGRLDARAHRQFDDGVFRIVEIDHFGNVYSRCGLLIDAWVVPEIFHDAVADRLGGRAREDGKLSFGLQYLNAD
jgi:hypothetical protein